MGTPKTLKIVILVENRFKNGVFGRLIIYH